MRKIKLLKGNTEIRSVRIIMVTGKCLVLRFVCVHTHSSGVCPLPIGNSKMDRIQATLGCRSDKVGRGIGTTALCMEGDGKTAIHGPTRKRLFCMSISLCVCVHARWECVCWLLQNICFNRLARKSLLCFWSNNDRRHAYVYTHATNVHNELRYA